ncbi:MAG: hypothetical protein HYT98_01565 [Candidatus Sungbacteria bacterium]|nr:hypothetical protein [Candidatus Sungbacteria bacterium]
MTKPVILIIFILGAALATFFYLVPEWRDFQALRQENTQLSRISEELDKLLQIRDSLSSSMASIPPDDLERVDKLIPNGPQGPEYIAFLEYIGKARGVLLKTVSLNPPLAPVVTAGQPLPEGSPDPALLASAVKEIPLAVTLASTYEGFKNFLSDLEKSVRFTDVQDINFGGASGESKDAPTFTIRARTYFQ